MNIFHKIELWTRHSVVYKLLTMTPFVDGYLFNVTWLEAITVLSTINFSLIYNTTVKSIDCNMTSWMGAHPQGPLYGHTSLRDALFTSSIFLSNKMEFRTVQLHSNSQIQMIRFFSFHFTFTLA